MQDRDSLQCQVHLTHRASSSCDSLPPMARTSSLCPDPEFVLMSALPDEDCELRGERVHLHTSNTQPCVVHGGRECYSYSLALGLSTDQQADWRGLGSVPLQSRECLRRSHVLSEAHRHRRWASPLSPSACRASAFSREHSQRTHRVAGGEGGPGGCAAVSPGLAGALAPPSGTQFVNS